MKCKRTKELSDQLRAPIDASEMANYRIAQEAEIGHVTPSRFANRKAGVSIDNMDRLGEILELKLLARRPTKKGR